MGTAYTLPFLPLPANASAWPLTNRGGPRFEPDVVRLLAAAIVFVPLATAVGGGLTGASPGQVWAFLIPASAIMALGPRRAIWCFVAFVAMILVLAAVVPDGHHRHGERDEDVLGVRQEPRRVRGGGDGVAHDRVHRSPWKRSRQVAAFRSGPESA